VHIRRISWWDAVTYDGELDGDAHAWPTSNWGGVGRRIERMCEAGSPALTMPPPDALDALNLNSKKGSTKPHGREGEIMDRSVRAGSAVAF
jgi:hypothetical protein